MAKVPFGKGYRRGPDAAVNQDESFALRQLVAQLLPLVGSKRFVFNILLSADERRLYFDATGKGIPGRDYEGWAICNGQNGLPNLAERFLRWSSSASGGQGGQDTATHYHILDQNGGAAIWVDEDSGEICTTPYSGTNFLAATLVTGDLAVGDLGDPRPAVPLVGTTGEPSAPLDNRPAFYELVPIARL